MNIRKYDSKTVSVKHILSKGFEIFDYDISYDFTMKVEIPQFKNDKIKIVGGYYTWYIKDFNNKLLWEGWWNSNDEFDQTIEIIIEKIKK